MTRLYGRAPRGERVIADVPGGHWKTWTMLSAINADGRMPTMVFEGGTDVAAMQAFVDHLLLPELQPDDIVVMDNLAAHKSQSVIQRIESVGAKAWFLPTYSPDLNPIEQIWSKVKSLLKTFAARTDKKLMTAIRKAIQAVTRDDILNSIIHAGYVNTLS
mgnify:CR=1 FL=1